MESKKIEPVGEAHTHNPKYPESRTTLLVQIWQQVRPPETWSLDSKMLHFGLPFFSNLLPPCYILLQHFTGLRLKHVEAFNINHKPTNLSCHVAPWRCRSCGASMHRHKHGSRRVMSWEVVRFWPVFHGVSSVCPTITTKLHGYDVGMIFKCVYSTVYMQKTSLPDL